MPPGAQFPIPPLTWPHVGSQWPTWNIESDQADGLVMWMPWGGGTVPGGHSYVDQITGRTFTKAGTPAWVSDSERGWSMLFDNAQSEHLARADGCGLTDYPVTLSTWFNTDTYANQGLIDIVATDRCSLWLRDPGDNDVLAYSGTGGAYAASSTSYTTDTWHHACGVFASATDRRAFLDGGGKGTNAVSIAWPNPTNTYLAQWGSFYLSGSLNDIRIYNVAKNDVEVYQIATDPWDLYQIPRRLWRLGVVAPPPAGQPIHLRALNVPHMRQWQPGRR